MKAIDCRVSITFCLHQFIIHTANVSFYEENSYLDKLHIICLEEAIYEIISTTYIGNMLFKKNS